MPGVPKLTFHVRLTLGRWMPLIVVAAGLTACGGSPSSVGGLASGSITNLPTVAASDLTPIDLSSGRRLKITVTTGLLAEAVGAVGGEHIDLTQLVPTGADPHDYELAPQEVVNLHEADVILMSGMGYEVFLTRLLGGTPNYPPVVALSDGITPLTIGDELASQPAAAGGVLPGEVDPHVWFDPENVIRWTENADRALSALDPTHAAAYSANASVYIDQIRQLDQWVTAQVSTIPASHRKLVADHEVLGYLAQRYGFTVVGAISPGTSDVAEPSARQLVALENTLTQEGVRAIFVGTYDNHSLANQVGSDTGIPVVPLYLESLSPPDGPAAMLVRSWRR
jgi:ABC-type Zn uptake system ZnuABC Zn-binding protein ZnuA